jgi:hypothetical protein
MNTNSPSNAAGSDEREFISLIDSWVLDGCKSGVRQFGNLIHSLPGVYPSEVLASLRRLSDQGAISRQALRAFDVEANSIPKEKLASDFVDARHLEHPLDFEWRFTKTAVARICSEIRTCSSGNRVLCLGCPTVYWQG